MLHLYRKFSWYNNYGSNSFKYVHDDIQYTKSQCVYNEMEILDFESPFCSICYDELQYEVKNKCYHCQRSFCKHCGIKIETKYFVYTARFIKQTIFYLNQLRYYIIMI